MNSVWPPARPWSAKATAGIQPTPGVWDRYPCSCAPKSATPGVAGECDLSDAKADLIWSLSAIKTMTTATSRNSLGDRDRCEFHGSLRDSGCIILCRLRSTVTRGGETDEWYGNLSNTFCHLAFHLSSWFSEIAVVFRSPFSSSRFISVRSVRDLVSGDRIRWIRPTHVWL